MDLFDVGLDNNDLLDGELVTTPSVTEADFLGLDVDDPVLSAQRANELERRRRTREEALLVRTPDALDLDLVNLDPANSTVTQSTIEEPEPAVTTSGERNTSIEFDSDQALTAKTAKDALEVEVKVLQEQANNEEAKREAIVDALSSRGYSLTDANNLYNTIPEEFKRNVAELHMLRRAQRRFNGTQGSANATISRNLISTFFGDPTQAPIDRATANVNQDIKNFKGAKVIRDALIQAVKEEDESFSVSKQLEFEREAAKLVRVTTPILLKQEASEDAKNAVIEDFKRRNPDATGTNREIYQLALADQIAEERRNNQLKIELDKDRIAVQREQIASTKEGRSEQVAENKRQEGVRAKEAKARLLTDLRKETTKEAKAYQKRVDTLYASVLKQKAQHDAIQATLPPNKQTPFPARLQAVIDNRGTSLVQRGSETVATLRPVLEVLSKYDGGADGYNAANHPRLKGLALTSMDLAAVKKLRKEAGTKGTAGTDAVGAFQFTGSTLAEAQKGAGLDDTDAFSPENQRKMAAYLISSRTSFPTYLAKVQAGTATEADANSLQNDLAKIWAAIPVATDIKNSKGKTIKAGTGYYDGTTKEGDVNKANPNASESVFNAINSIGSLQVDSLDNVEALLAGNATALSEAQKGNSPRSQKAERVQSQRDTLLAISTGLGDTGNLNILPKGVEVYTSGDELGGIIAPFLKRVNAMVEADAGGGENSNLNSLSSSVTQSVAGAVKAIQQQARGESTTRRSVVINNGRVDYLATMKAPITQGSNLSSSIFNPAGMTVAHDLNAEVQKLGRIPTLREVGRVAAGFYKNDLDKAAKETIKYLKRVAALKVESQAGKTMRLGLGRPELRVEVNNGPLKDYLTKNRRNLTVSLEGPDAYSYMKQIIRPNYANINPLESRSRASFVTPTVEDAPDFTPTLRNRNPRLRN